MVGHIEFKILGPLEVWTHQGRLRLYGPRQETVAGALLLDAGRPVTVTRLVDAVWDDNPPATARHQVQDLVARLRRTLTASGAAPGLITTTRAGYALHIADAHLDSHAFELLVAAARDAAPHDAGAAAAQYRAGLTLWRGPALAGIASRDLSGRASHLDERRLTAWEDCLALELGLGRHHELVGELYSLAVDHPYRERFWTQLMLALYRSGRQAEALAAYQQARQALLDKLGLEPGAELRQLQRAVLCNDPTLDLPARAPITTRQPPPTPAAAAARVVPAQLPADVPAFTGRAEPLKYLDTLLSGVDGPAPAVVISAIAGTAGVGKTALAVHWAHKVRDQFPDGQLYVNLRGYDPGGSPMSPAGALRRLLDAFAIPPERIPASLDAQAGLYRSLLADRRVLVVLDNARDTDQVRPLLPGAPGCLALVTSRNQLTSLVAAEGAHALTLDLLSHDEARALLSCRLGADRAAAEPTAVDQIITLCARLPLALAVVAARAATHPQFRLAALAEELSAPRGGLGAFDGGDVATDIRAVFSWSLHTLSAEAARLFRLLGLHPGPDIDAPAAASLAGICNDRVQPLLRELTRAHLLAEHTPGRYTFHDLLRAYASELTHTHDGDAERHGATHRILDHYLHTAHTAALLLNPHRDPITLTERQPAVTCHHLPNDGQALAWFTVEHPVLLATIRQAAGAGFTTHAWQLAWTITEFFDRRGHWHDWAATQRTALDAARRGADRPGQAQALRGLARAHVRMGRDEDAGAHLRHALDIFRQLGDQAGQARTHLDLAWLSDRRGRPHEALCHARSALDLYQAARHRAGQALALNAVGWHYARLGDHQQAIAYCQRALALQQDLADRRGLADTWDSLGYAHHHLGDHRQAAMCYKQALDLSRELGDRYDEAATLTRLGDTHHAVADADAARHAWRQALDILDELGHPDADQIRAKLHD